MDLDAGPARRAASAAATGRRRARPPASTWRTGAVAVNRLEAANGWSLREEQCAAVQAMVDGTCPVTLVSGVGGSGKTTVLAAVNEANKNHRYGLLVASTATIAASTAGDASGARWMNLTALRHAIWDKRPIAAHIIVIDEASMADGSPPSTRGHGCAQTGKRLVLMGDLRQLRAVGAGAAFNALCAEHPDRVVRLQTNQRQRTDLGRTIADALHSRDVESAWEHMTADGAVLVARSREHKLHVLAATVASRIDQHGAGQVTCDAVTNAEVDELNARIHERLIAAGNVDTAGVVTYRSSRGERRIGVGTVLRVTRPTGVAAKPGTQLIRGERATVTSTSRERVTVTFDDGRTRAIKPRTLLAHFDYGYAGTTHKVQGQTSSVHVASLGPAKDIASMYVSATRARDETLFVLDARDYLTDKEMREVSSSGTRAISTTRFWSACARCSPVGPSASTRRIRRCSRRAGLAQATLWPECREWRNGDVDVTGELARGTEGSRRCAGRTATAIERHRGVTRVSKCGHITDEQGQNTKGLTMTNRRAQPGVRRRRSARPVIC
ncbi:MAG: AAA family ATPase [Actinobacteria bacterium]|nr:AAA family ATPase [Actinomycetota bacterium]